jgi:phosphatidylglycerol:prolipoprotein diacylglycerol transferase
LWNLVGLILLLILRRRPFLRAGELLVSYFVWYAVGRFFVEGLRTDSLCFTGPAWLEGLMKALWSPMTILFEPGAMPPGENVRISQLLSVLIVLAAIVTVYVRRKKGYAREHYLDPLVSSKASDKRAGGEPGSTIQPNEQGALQHDPNDSV